MGKIRFSIILLLIFTAFTAGIYLKEGVVDIFNNLGSQVKNFQQKDFTDIVLEFQKKVFTPSPLNVGGEENQIVLLKSKIIEETNLQRQQNRLPQLKENVFLNNASSAKAYDMFENQYFEHVSPLRVGPGELVSSYGYEYIITGENLILGNFSSEKQVLENWMASPGHRENILNNRYLEIGVAVVKGTYKGQTVWIGVQEFGLPLSACPQPSAEIKSQIDINKEHLDDLLLQIDERKEQIDHTPPVSAAYRHMVDDYNQLVAQYNSLAEQLKLEIANYNNQISIFNACVEGK